MLGPELESEAERLAVVRCLCLLALDLFSVLVGDRGDDRTRLKAGDGYVGPHDRGADSKFVWLIEIRLTPTSLTTPREGGITGIDRRQLQTSRRRRGRSGCRR